MEWGWNIKIPIRIHTCANIYAVGINTEKMIKNIKNNNNEKDNNVHKVAQGLIKYIFCI